MRNLTSIMFSSIDAKEQKAWKAFVEKHKKHGVHCSGNGVSIEVAGDSIGGYTIVMKCSCGKTKNITNFDNW